MLVLRIERCLVQEPGSRELEPIVPGDTTIADEQPANGKPTPFRKFARQFLKKGTSFETDIVAKAAGEQKSGYMRVTALQE